MGKSEGLGRGANLDTSALALTESTLQARNDVTSFAIWANLTNRLTPAIFEPMAGVAYGICREDLKEYLDFMLDDVPHYVCPQLGLLLEANSSIWFNCHHEMRPWLSYL